MVVSESYLTFVPEQLGGVRGLVTRRMFGGVGISSGDACFAIIDNAVLTVSPAHVARRNAAGHWLVAIDWLVTTK